MEEAALQALNAISKVGGDACESLLHLEGLCRSLDICKRGRNDPAVANSTIVG